MASVSAQACVFASLILQDDGIEISADKLQTLTKKAGVEVEPIWFSLFAKALDGKDLKEFIMNVGSGGSAGSAPAAAGETSAKDAPKEEAKKEEEKEESDEDMGFGLFD